jgi:hypothetical protein
MPPGLVIPAPLAAAAAHATRSAPPTHPPTPRQPPPPDAAANPNPNPTPDRAATAVPPPRASPDGATDPFQSPNAGGAPANDGRAPAAPTPDGDVAPDSAAARARRTQLTPIDYGQARMLLWNASHEDTVSILRRCGLRPVNAGTHRARLDEQRAIATQHARPMVALPPTGLRPEREIITSDTLGGKFPVSRAGNKWCMTHTFSSRPHQVYVSFSPDHAAESSWTGLRKACREAGITVLAEAISQPIEFVSDNGTEFLGVFAQRLQQAGIMQSASTAHKRRKHGAQVAETSNSAINAMLRKGLVMCRANFEAHKLDARDYWDYLIEAAATAVSTLRRAKATGEPPPSVGADRAV